MSESADKNVPKRTADTAEIAFKRLVEGIVTGEIPGGQPLREASIAREWNLSRTPVREAVRRAAEANLLILRPNRAPLVRALTLHDVTCLYEMREVLETLALEQAWDNIPEDTLAELSQMKSAATPHESDEWVERCLIFDEALHHCWVDHCSNPWLVISLRRILTFVSIFKNVMAQSPEAVEFAYIEHCAILECLLQKNMTQGKECLQSHIRNAGNSAWKRFESPDAQVS